MSATPSANQINILQYRRLYFLISLLVIIPGVISLARNGLRPAIDFTGGTLLEVQFVNTPALSEDQIRQALPQDIEISTVQKTGDQSYLVRAKEISKDKNEELKLLLASASAQLKPANEATQAAEATASASVEELRFETVGPTLGKELLRKTLFAIVIAAISIMLYIAYRFKELKYGLCAIAAMLHDTTILIGIFSLLGYYFGVEVDTLFVTAVLTTLSFSVHDTIVVYDRIRELKTKHKKTTNLEIYNKAVVETLTRSVNNSMTIIFMLAALWLFGGETIKWFVFALLIGTVAGTYSSPFTAVPLLIVWDEFVKKRSRK